MEAQRMDSKRTVAITGATGFVGRSVVRECLRRGWDVRALVRSRTKAREVLPRPAEGEGTLLVVEGDVLDANPLRELVRGLGENDACIHLIGIIREAAGGQTFRRMHVEATRAVVEACERFGPRRYIHMSALGVHPEGKAQYQKTKWEAETFVRRSSLDWTVMRPSLIHGPDGEFVQMIKSIAGGQQPPYYFIPYFSRTRIDNSVFLGPVLQESAMVQPVYVEDVAYAFAEAVQRPEAVGEVYNLVGPKAMTWPQMLATLRDGLPGTHRLPIAPLPAQVGYSAARIAQTLGLGALVPFDPGQALMAVEDQSSELVKVRTHLGLEPQAFDTTLAAYGSHA